MKEYTKAVYKNGHIKVESTMSAEHLDNVIAQLQTIRREMAPRPKVLVMKNAREHRAPKKALPAGWVIDSVCVAVVGTREAAENPSLGMLEEYNA